MAPKYGKGLKPAQDIGLNAFSTSVRKRGYLFLRHYLF